ncbi:MAG: hypothetical protein L0G69_07595 [Brevibacterium sp.]|nr:hypothetical protein [Brevibacterium sp.]
MTDSKRVHGSSIPSSTRLRRGSSFIWGVWHDAKYLADQIEIQRKYRDYEPDHTALLESAVS